MNPFGPTVEPVNCFLKNKKRKKISEEHGKTRRWCLWRDLPKQPSVLIIVAARARWDRIQTHFLHKWTRKPQIPLTCLVTTYAWMEREREVDLGNGCHRRPHDCGGHQQPRGLLQSWTFTIGLLFFRVDFPFSTSMRPSSFRYRFISNLKFFIYFKF